MNQYGSILRRLISRNVLKIAALTVNPPANLVFGPGGGGNISFDLNQAFLDPNSNFIIRKLGLFCNFADGLVAKVTTPMQLVVSFTYMYNPIALTGLITTDPASNALVGVGTNFLAELPPATWIVESPGLAVGGYPLYVNMVTTNVDATIDSPTTPPQQYGAGWAYSKLTPGITFGGAIAFIDTMHLNQMMPLDYFVNVTSHMPVTTTPTYLVLQAFIQYGSPVEFFTKTIDPAYAGDPCTFDIVMDVEFTQR